MLVDLDQFEMDILSSEIGGQHTRENKAEWVLKLEEELRQEGETSGRNPPVIYSVPKALLASDRHFYIPSFISVGPYHFESAELKSMEPHKIEAVRRMQQRIRRSMQRIVETEIMTMEKDIREFYDKELSYSATDLAWMVTKDSCFLFEFLFNYLKMLPGGEELLNDYVLQGRYDAVLNSSASNTMWENILYDHALLENQIPLFVLQYLLPIAYPNPEAETILGNILGKVASLDSKMVFRWGVKQPYSKQKCLHFLDVLYNCHVGGNLECYRQPAYSSKDGPLLNCDWTKSMLTCFRPRGMTGRVEDRVLGVKLPSAAELKKKGVNLCVLPSTDSAAPDGVIQCVRFDESSSTLYLPEVNIDHFRHALLRNFIALEYTSEKYSPYPITSFAFFMDELVDSEEDVAVLREANIINIMKSFFGSNKETAECFIALTMGYHWSEGCKPIDDARVGLHKYLRRKNKILWNEFISTYFAKPWLVAGSVGAFLLLLMTMLECLCLFLPCDRPYWQEKVL